MIIGHHLIWTAYGWWLPNDPRGSMSRELRNDALIDLGDLHYGRKRIQPANREITRFYAAAAGSLQFNLLKFTAEEVAAIADSFAGTIQRRNYTCYACAIMPEHIHLLIRRHRDLPEAMIEAFQEDSRTAILQLKAKTRGIDHPVWGGPGWKVFLNTPIDMRRIVRYIENNPIKIGLPKQVWSFVKPYDGWMPGRVTIAKSQAHRPRKP
jgi:REP element-mobilizing transposase RayT